MLGQLSFAIFPYFFITSSNILSFFLSSIPLSIAAGLIFPTIASSTNFIENKTQRIYQTYQQASFSFGFIISGIFASVFFYLKKYFDFDGLNLTWETLEGLVKHNGPIEGNAPPTILKLSNEFDLELGEYSSLEAQIASISDDIAYNNHDIDDGLRAGFFTFNELRELPLIGNIVERLPRNFETRDIQRINNEITRRSTNLMMERLLTTDSI